MPVVVITPEHRVRLAPLLGAAFRLRRRIFVDRLGWALPGDDGDQETDAFDHGPAWHLVGIDDTDRVVSTARMTPAAAPNVTCDVLAEHALRPPPRDLDVVESSRFCVDLALPPEARATARSELYAAHYELCLRQGWTRTIGVFGVDQLGAFVRRGFGVDFLGPPTRFGPDEPLSVVYALTTDFEHADAMRRWMGEPVILDPEDEAVGRRFGDSALAA